MAAGVAGAVADGINSTPRIKEDQGVVDQERMDYELLKALKRGDERFVKNLFLRATEKASVAEVRQVTIELLDAGNFTEAAADTIFRGVTAGRNSALHVAAEFGHLELANFICDKDRSLLAAQNAALETPLHCAARAGAHQILSRFISVAEWEGVSRSVAVLHATDRQGKTALYTAAQEGHAAAARVLMSADPGLAAIVDHKGVSPLYAAALSASLEVVQVLLGEQVRSPAGVATPEASYAGPNGQTALHAAALVENPAQADRKSRNQFGPKMESTSHNTAPISKEEEEEEWKWMGNELLDALMRGDANFVRLLFSPVTEPSVAAGHALDIDLPDADNVADQAGSRSCQVVTVAGRNSALHIVATFGHWELAELICARDSSLLEARNAALETPLHCAARVGADRIVSLFISEARQLEALLRATDREGKTALHAAAEQGHAAVARDLVSADPGLAAIVDKKSVSPLYAAVLSKSLQVVQILIEFPAEGGTQAGTTSVGATPKTSYAGPNKQTALHAAAIVQSPEIAEELLKWEAKLAKRVDDSGSTPLHYLVTTSNTDMVHQQLEHDDSIAYHSDSKGFYPIHIATRMGSWSIIHALIDRCQGMHELVDNEGRNFLHIAVLDDIPMVVKHVCQHRKLVRMMNARDNEGNVCQHQKLVRMMNTRDNEGNTPLHLAVCSHNQEIVRLLLENESVHPSIKNNDGKTPLDLAIIKINYDLISIQNPEIWIFHCLQQIGAIHGTRRLDHLIYDSKHKDSAKQNRENEPNKYESTKQNHENEPNKYESAKQNRENEPNKYESTAQNLVIVSVLIATMTFAAAFTVPGGIIADDHQKGGTPTLARKYAFTAFIISDCIAFCCSIMATIWLIYAGSLSIHHSGQLNLILRSQDFMDVAAQCMMAAFALSVYVVLSPVYFPFALAICLSVFPSVLFSSPEFWQRFLLTRTLKRRLGWSAMCKNRVIGPPLGLAMNSINWYIFPPMKNFNWYIVRPIVSYLLVYMLIFGASLIFSINHLHII